MKSGTDYKPGTIILAKVSFTDESDSKIRPALVLFSELSNYIVAGITSNTHMKGIPLTKQEGMVKNSKIKLNYIFTISKNNINKSITSISKSKKNIIYSELNKRLLALTS